MVILFVFGCQPNTETQEEKTALTKEKLALPYNPKVSFTFDDGITRDIATYKFEDGKYWMLMSLFRIKYLKAFQW